MLCVVLSCGRQGRVSYCLVPESQAVGQLTLAKFDRSNKEGLHGFIREALASGAVTCPLNRAALQEQLNG